MQINIIIPCYNEFENINILLQKISTQPIQNLKIIIIDDSKYSYKNKIKKYFKNLKYIHRKKKLGRGSAVLFGIKTILKNLKKNDLIIEMDADLSHDPSELVRNIKFFKKNKLDMLISSRYFKKSKIINWPQSRRVFSFLSNLLTRFLLNVPVSDYTNGFRIYSCAAAIHINKNCGKIGDGYIVLSEILVSLYKQNFKIREIHSKFVNRIRGESNVTFSEIINALIGLIKIYKIKKAKL